MLSWLLTVWFTKTILTFMLFCRYFHKIMEIIIDVLFDWDQAKQCPKGKGGIFGTTEAFFASTESQNSTGSLHAHIMVWIRGMPTTLQEYYHLRETDDFRCKLVKYVDSALQASYPVDTATCPQCDAAELESIGVDKQAFRKPKKGSPRPMTTRCNSCHSTYGADELVRQCMMKRCRNDRDTASKLTDETFSLYQLAMPHPLPHVHDPNSLEAITSTQALLTYQNHHWFHSNSCFKRSKRTPSGKSCRMFFPKQVCTATQWNEFDSIELRRTLGSEYLNPYVPVVNEVIKANHDLKILSACEGTLVGPSDTCILRRLIRSLALTLDILISLRSTHRLLHDEIYDKKPERP